MANSKILTASTSKAVPAAGYATPGVTTRTAASLRLVWLFSAAVLFSAIALAISGYLSYVAFTSTKILGCGGGVFSCDHVLTSKWSTLLGLPVAAWAGSMYLGVLTALLGTARSAVSAQPSLLRQWTWSIVTTAAVSAGLAALWFIGLQAFVLEHFCPWCLGAHTCGICLSIATLCYSPLAGQTKAMCASLGFTGTLGLVVIQLMTPAPQTFEVENFPQTPIDGGVIEEPATFDAPGGDGGDVFMAPDAQSSVPSSLHGVEWLAQWDSALRMVASPTLMLTTQVADQGTKPAAQAPAAAGTSAANAQNGTEAPPAAAAPVQRTVHLSRANIKLKPEHWPMVGSPTAKHIFVEMFDYTCKHCRKTQKAVLGARTALAGDLGIIVLPVPLNRNCNPYATGNPNANACELAELSLAVWKADPADPTGAKPNFEKFHEWLLTGDNPPGVAEAKAKAEGMVGAAALKAEKETAVKFLKSTADIYNRAGAGAVPKLIFPTTVLTGEMQAPQPLIDTILRQPAQ